MCHEIQFENHYQNEGWNSSSNEIFDLNATSMLDQPDALIKNDFEGSQINLDLLSY